MTSTQAVPATNRLLADLPSKDRQHLLASCEPVELMLADILSNPGDPIRYVYFPTDSVISLVTPIDGHSSLEVALVGQRQGYAPLGKSVPFVSFVCSRGHKGRDICNSKCL